MPAIVPKLKLSDGSEMPIIGLGTYARNADPGQFRQATEWGIDAGYRHVDTAACYGNEEEIAEAIAAKVKQGFVKREELFITTKLWNENHAESNVVPALNESLARLKLDYVDLYLIHWPVSVSHSGEDMKIDYLETWRGMEEAHRLGLTKSIGVSNFNEQQLGRLLQHARVKPVCNQFEINPTLSQHRLVDYCKSLGVQPVAYTPLGLISDARPEFAGIDTIKTDPALGTFAEKYSKSRAQVALRYLIQRNIVVLPKSFTHARIKENLNIFDFQLTDKEMAIMDRYNLNHRCVPGNAFKKFENYPFGL